jgi:hypothetical protein
MLLVYNAQANKVGIWEPGWNYVLTTDEVWVWHKTCIKSMQLDSVADYSREWYIIGTY